MKKSKFLLNRIITYGLVCMTLLSSCLLAGIYAKYISSKNKNISTEINNFNITVDDDKLVNFSKNLSVAMNPQSEPQTYTFTITNASEVGVSLRVTLETEGNLPLLFSCKVGNGTETNLTADSEGNYSCDYTLEANNGTAIQTQYTICVKWDATYKGYEYSNGVETVRLTLHAEQNN